MAACFISVSIGTSVGTVVALVPIAAGLAHSMDANVGMMTAIIVGGTYFGDNLSFISDTTVVATQTTNCKMSDKFKVNSMIVVPAAVLYSCCSRIEVRLFSGPSPSARARIRQCARCLRRAVTACFAPDLRDGCSALGAYTATLRRGRSIATGTPEAICWLISAAERARHERTALSSP